MKSCVALASVSSTHPDASNPDPDLELDDQKPEKLLLEKILPGIYRGLPSSRRSAAAHWRELQLVKTWSFFIGFVVARSFSFLDPDPLHRLKSLILVLVFLLLLAQTAKRNWSKQGRHLNFMQGWATMTWMWWRLLCSPGRRDLECALFDNGFESEKKTLRTVKVFFAVDSVMDPYPSDSYVFGPHGSVSPRNGSGSWSFYYHQAKIVRKTKISRIRNTGFG